MIKSIFQAVRRLQWAAWPQVLPRPPWGHQEHWHMSLLWPQLHEEQAADESRVSHEATKWEIRIGDMKILG